MANGMPPRRPRLRRSPRIGDVKLLTVSGEQDIQSTAAKAGESGHGARKKTRGFTGKNILTRLEQLRSIVADRDLCVQAVTSPELPESLSGESEQVPRRVPAEKGLRPERKAERTRAPLTCPS